MPVNYCTEACDFIFRGKRKTSAWIRRTARTEGWDTGAVSVVFCSDERLLEINNKYQVKNNVGNRTDNQDVERPPGVSDCPQDSGTHVVEHQTGNSGKINTQVLGRFREHIFRRIHEPQENRRQNQADDSKENSQHKGQGNSCMNCPVNCLVIAASEAVGNNNAGTSSKSGKKADNRIDNTVCRTNGCQRGFADIVSDNNTVYRIIKLLKQISDQKRERKQN